MAISSAKVLAGSERLCSNIGQGTRNIKLMNRQGSRVKGKKLFFFEQDVCVWIEMDLENPPRLKWFMWGYNRSNQDSRAYSKLSGSW
jgi:hypothetical protein